MKYSIAEDEEQNGQIKNSRQFYKQQNENANDLQVEMTCQEITTFECMITNHRS